MKTEKRILIVVLLLVIGFASVSTTLVITGVIGISNKKDDFRVIFTNAKLDGIDRNDFIDDINKQTITFESKTLTTLEESTTIEYEVTNTSRLYDANVEVLCNIVDDMESVISNEYITLNNQPSNMIVSAGKTEKGILKATLKKSSIEDQNIKVKCELNATAIERETLGDEYIPPINVSFDANGGDEIKSMLKVNSNQEYGEMPTPTRNEYEFLGWYTSQTGGTKVTNSTIVSTEENHMLYAHWIRRTINFSYTGWKAFTLADGTINNPSYGADISIPIESGGYSIQASCNLGPALGNVYFTNSNGEKENICLKDSYESGTASGTYQIIGPGVLTLHGTSNINVEITETKNKVVFVLNEGYIITYDFNGGKSIAPNYAYINFVNKGDTIPIPFQGSNCSKEGYKWIGFATTRDATEEDVIQTLTPNENITLYAVYKEV